MTAQTIAHCWDLAIAMITPIIVWAIHRLVPKLPKWILPLCTPLIGIGLGLAIEQLLSAHLFWVDVAKAGALAVFVREVFNQTVTKHLQDLPNRTPQPMPPTPPA